MGYSKVNVICVDLYTIIILLFGLIWVKVNVVKVNSASVKV
jgi:hypothetical protein